jgi:predicted transcriptional regulator
MTNINRSRTEIVVQILEAVNGYHDNDDNEGLTQTKLNE